jgi:hypothetical protein
MSEYFDKDKFKKKLKKKIKKGVNLDVSYKKRSSSGFYFLGFLGSAIYFISHASGFWDGVLGFLKAVVWPAFLTYEAFANFLG